jgi:hypothetical protein
MPEHITHPDLRLLYEYWLGVCRGRIMPRRVDIDPTELPGRVWEHLTLADVVAEGGAMRFRYRLVGEQLVDALGRNPVGEFYDAVLPKEGGYRDYVTGVYRTVVDTKKPYYTENTYTLAGQSVPMLTKRLTLPLSDDGQSVNITLSSHYFEYPIVSHSYMVEGISGFAELIRRELPSS